MHRGLQRYRCRARGKTFTALTGTLLARLRHRSKWLDYLGRMLDSSSVCASANTVGVHRNTSFRWRHRFLHLGKHDRPEGLRGIAEADELFLLESQKGARQLTRPAQAGKLAAAQPVRVQPKVEPQRPQALAAARTAARPVPAKAPAKAGWQAGGGCW